MKINELTQNYIEDLSTLATTQVQKVALENFKSRGLPHRKMEDWIYTKVTDVLPARFLKVAPVTEFISKTNIKSVGKYKVVFLNGTYKEELSVVPKELKFNVTKAKDVGEALYKDDGKDIFAMINVAAGGDILNIFVPKNHVVDDVISIVHISSFENSFSTPSIHIEMEKFSQCQFVEIFTGENDKKYNQIAVTNINVAEGAKATHVKVIIEGDSAFHVGTVNANVLKDATFNGFTFNTGALKSRNNCEVWLRGIGAECSVDGLYALNENQHCDNFLKINHLVEHTHSTQLFKGILSGASRGVFTGNIFVKKDAQQVTSQQLNKNLLLSKKAHIDTRPQLEVYADDVKCAHGATVGQMSEEEGFYLQSRGLSKERAQKLLIHGFCADTIEKINSKKIQTFLTEILFESFEKEMFLDIDSNPSDA